MPRSLWLHGWHRTDTQKDAFLRVVDDEDGYFQIDPTDAYVNAFFAELNSKLPRSGLLKWSGKASYRYRFIDAVDSCTLENFPVVNAYSFQERVLRQSADALIAAYCAKMVNPPAITRVSSEGEPRYQFAFPDMPPQVVPEHKALVILLLAWSIIDQWNFMRNDVVNSKKYNFEGLKLAIATDTLSSDAPNKRPSETLLQMLIPGDIAAVRTLKTEPEYAFADNMAGWLNAVIRDNSSDWSARFKRSSKFERMAQGWYEIVQPVEGKFAGRLVKARLTDAVADVCLS